MAGDKCFSTCVRRDGEMVLSGQYPDKAKSDTLIETNKQHLIEKKPFWIRRKMHLVAPVQAAAD